ncbi:truncated ClcA homolog, partial [Aeropyrum pernix]
MQGVRRAAGWLSYSLSHLLARAAYAEKWVVLGVAIGVASAAAALAFYWLLGVVAGLTAYLLTGQASGDDLGLVLSKAGGAGLLTPLAIVGGALASSLIVYRFSPEAEGHGTDAAIKAFHRRAAQIPFRTGVVKAVASSILVGTGGSGGVQGSGVQIGASIGSTIARLLRLRIEDRRVATVAGMSGALSALFHSPLGSAFFAAEVLYKRDLEVQALVPAFVSSITAYTLATVAGYEPPLPRLVVDGSDLYSPQSIASYILLGAFLAPFGYLYARLLRESETGFRRLESLGLPRTLRPVLGAAGLSLLVYAAPFVAGSGMGVLAAVLSGEPVSWIPVGEAGLWAFIVLAAAGLLKIAATSLSIGSGGSGGVFAPGLLGGALLGLSFYALIQEVAQAPLPAAAYAY